MSLHRALIVAGLIALLLGGCALPGGWQEEDVSESAAVTSLRETAAAQRANGLLVDAQATLERALRIEPRNARLWYQLAGVQMDLGKYQQAESMALRASRYVGDNRRMNRAVWNLVADARQAKGDTGGAQQARDRAANF